ncbi:MAG: polysaccharide biosynthesis tyrosine autokinase [Desulfobacterales bacterium]|nr:polysaccharide biosynthesis tyrosine autokinase [Desulfobacterales bacterium]
MAKKEGHNLPARAEDQGGENLPSTEYRSGIPYADEETHLRDYIEVVLRRKWLVIGVLFLTFVSTLIFSLAEEKLYRASGTLQISPESQRVTKFEEVAEQRLRAAEFVNTQVALLKSGALARRVIRQVNLKEHPVIAGDGEEKKEGLTTRLKKFVKSLIPRKEEAADANLGSISVEEVMADRRLLGFFHSFLSVSPRRDAMIIDVSFLSPDRRLSMDVVNQLMDQYLDWQMDQKVESSENTRQYLMRQIDRAKIHLEKAEEEQHRFARRAGIVSLDSRLNSVYKQLEDVNAALGQAETELVRKETKYRQAVADGPENLPEVLQSEMISGLKSEYARLRSEYENLTETFHPDYPEVRKLQRRMDSLAERIDEESERSFNAIRHEYLAAQEWVVALEGRLEENKQRALALNEVATQYSIMAREVETNKAIYQSLLERAKEIESMAGISPSNIRIVDRASLPISPAMPDVRRNLLLAVVLGLMMGVGLAFLTEYFADTITNPDQISDRFQIPILGVIPLEKDAEGPVERVFVNDPQAAISEAFRTSKVSIQLSGSDSAARCIAVTSTAPGEGKTTVCTNLAQTFAGAGEKVLLIDADLRKPRLHKIFSAGAELNGHGLSSFLAGVIDDGYLGKTDVENLYMIPSGPIPPNPVELLASNRFSDLLEKAAERFDRIIVDAPPHHGFADVLVLSQKVGGLILVSSINESTRDGLRHFKKAMNNLQANVLGCIVNKINLAQRYGYRSYYRYYRAYNYEYGKEKKVAAKKRARGAEGLLEEKD